MVNNVNKRAYVGSLNNSKAVFGAQGQRLIPTIAQQFCGSAGISACMVFMPPGRVSKAHYHKNAELIVVTIEGFAATLIGDDLTPVFHGPGEFLFIPNGPVHVAVNLSNTGRVIAFETRTDPKFNEDVVQSPQLDARAAKIAADLQQKFAAGTLDLPKHWDLTQTGPFAFPQISEAQLQA